ncbi:acyl carrier protein [Ligilactobacillus cholophilus]|uniref:acyl carrier protein n=1 Tax=Ligilactobacillus cholophilus TaxID=3050131 RepID=UPI0025AF9587|nr:acyl carrier protein [Ligilactobacillus cholophilus]
MTEQEIFNKIADIMVSHFDIKKEDIKMDLNFKTDLDADSIDFVEFILDLEDAFGEEIPDEDAEKLNTVGDAVEYIQKNIK